MRMNTPSPFNEIRPWLLQTGLSALGPQGCGQQRFSHVVVLHQDLTWSPDTLHSGAAQVITVRVEDGDPIPGLADLYDALRGAPRILVVCPAGMSRSASLCVGLLYDREALPIADALADVREALRPAAGFASRFEPAWGTLASVLHGQGDLRRLLLDLDIDFIERRDDA